jgi:hypothetical protein
MIAFAMPDASNLNFQEFKPKIQFVRDKISEHEANAAAF